MLPVCCHLQATVVTAALPPQPSSWDPHTRGAKTQDFFPPQIFRRMRWVRWSVPAGGRRWSFESGPLEATAPLPSAVAPKCGWWGGA